MQVDHTKKQQALYVQLLTEMTGTPWKYINPPNPFVKEFALQYSNGSRSLIATMISATEWCNESRTNRLMKRYFTTYTTLEEMEQIESAIGRGSKCFAISEHCIQGRYYTVMDWSASKIIPLRSRGRLKRGSEAASMVGVL